MKFSKQIAKIHGIIAMILFALTIRSSIDSSIFTYYVIFGFAIVYTIELVEKYMINKVVDRGTIFGIVIMCGLGIACVLSDLRVVIK